MKLINTLLILLLTSLTVFSQPAIEWQKSFGGSSTDWAESIQQTSDGGYIVAGYSSSYDGDITEPKGLNFYWVVKLTSEGTLEWQKSLGGSLEDFATSIKETSDGDYIVVGNSSSLDGDITGNHGRFDYWVVKLDISGTIKWQKSYGGSENDFAESMQETSDGGYIIAGSSESIDGDITGNHGLTDIWILKITYDGDIEWQKSYGGSGYDDAWSIQQTTDGGYIVAGLSSSNDGDVTTNYGVYDFWVLKLNNTGVIQWQKSLGGSENEWAQSVRQTIDGGYIVAGMTDSSDGDITNNQGLRDFWILKLTDLGEMEWQKSLGGSNMDSAESIIQTQDAGYVVVGATESNDGDVTGNHGGRDLWMAKLNATGSLEWQKSYGGSEIDWAYSIQHTLDGGYVVSGVSSSSDGDVTFNNGYWDFWVLKLSSELGIIDSNLKNSVLLYPNPNNGKFFLDFPKEIEPTAVTVVDALGKIVYSETNIPSGSFEIDQNFTSGIYFVNVSSTSSETTLKMIVK